MRSRYLFLIQYTAFFFISYSGYVEWNNIWTRGTHDVCDMLCTNDRTLHVQIPDMDLLMYSKFFLLSNLRKEARVHFPKYSEKKIVHQPLNG
jgi:hypothetical protein